MGPMKTYTAPHDVYQGGSLYPPETPFTTDAPKGRLWSEAEAPRAPPPQEAPALAPASPARPTLHVSGSPQ